MDGLKQLDDGIGFGHGYPGPSAKMYPGHQAIGNILRQIPMFQVIGAPDHRMGDVPMDGHIQLLPGIIRRDVGKVRHRLQILISQSLGHSHPLPVHRQSQLRRRRGKAVFIQEKIHIRPLDAAGVHQTGPRMQGRVHQ